MTKESTLTAFSNHLADAVESAGASVVQVYGHRRPGSGVVYAPDVVVTTARALGRGDKLHVRTQDGVEHDAQLAGWDPATNLAVLRVERLGAPAAAIASAAARVGNLAVALARSWSNALTASAGVVSVIGGPLATSRRHAID